MSYETLGQNVNKLPCGVWIQAEQRHIYDFTFEPKVTGRVKKNLFEIQNRTNPAKVTTQFLYDLLLSIGDYTKENGKLTKDFITKFVQSDDRAYMLMVIRKNLFGNMIHPTFACDCGFKGSINYDLNGIPLTRMTESDFKISGTQKIWEAENKELGIKIVGRFAYGEDDEVIVPIIRKNIIEANFRIISRLVLSINGNPITYSDIENMDIKQLDWIDEVVGAKHYGIQTDFKVNCENCNTENLVALDPLDFFLNTRTKSTQS